MLRALQLPVPADTAAEVAPYGAWRQARPSPEGSRWHPHPARQQLLAERSLLQLAWIGLLAVRDGFTCPPDCAPPRVSRPPEPAAETVEAQLDPEADGRAIAAYRRAARLGGPRLVRRVDTHA